MLASPPPGTAGPGAQLDSRIAGNAVWLLVAQVTTLMVGLLVVVTLTRTVGVADLGRWRFAQAVVAVLLVVADVGLTGMAMREVARNPLQIGLYARPVIQLRLVLSAMMLAGLVIVVVLTSVDQASSLIVVLVALGLIPAALNAGYLFQAREAVGPVSRLRSLSLMAAGLVAIIGTVAFRDLVAAIVPFLIAGSITAAVTIVWARRAGYFGSSDRPQGWTLTLLVRATPFAIAALAIQVNFNADAFIIRALRGDEALGLYAAPYALAGYTLILGGAIIGAAYPRIAAHAGSNLSSGVLVKDVSAAMGLIAVPMSVGTMLLADQLTAALFGDAFRESGPILAALMMLPLLGYLNMTLGQALMARGAAGRVALIAIGAAVLNIALNLSLVPSLGVIGAAIAVACTEGATVVVYLVALWLRDGTFPLPAYLGSVRAVLAMALGVVIARQMATPLPVTVVLGGAVFVGVCALAPSRGVKLLVSVLPHRR